jgi:hypothetical protein
MTTVHTLIIPNWHPARLNSWDGRHWSIRARLKRGDREMVAAYARVARVPPAKGKRKVSLVITLAPRQRNGDVDAFWKSLLDALVSCKLLINDSPRWLDLGTVRFLRAEKRATRIDLHDLQP